MRLKEDYKLKDKRITGNVRCGWIAIIVVGDI